MVDIVKIIVFFQDMFLFVGMNGVYVIYFDGVFFVCLVVVVKVLFKDVLVEIECIVV